MLNEALRLIRIFHDMSQKDLAKKLGVSNSYISEIESGKKTPTLNILELYADCFQLPLSSILFFSEKLEEKDFSKEVRTFVSARVIKILNFIAERSGYDKAQDISVTPKPTI